MTKFDTECLIAAAQLGDMVLASEESLRLADARVAFEEEARTAQGSLAELDSAKEYVKAQDDFDVFATAVVDMLKMTIYGENVDTKSCRGCCKTRA